MKIKQLMYMPWWFFKSRILGKKAPLQTVLFITDYCNLKCKHCTPEGHGCHTMKSYKQIKEELIYAFKLGSRFIDFEGGEPLLWNDGNKNLNNLYRLAKDIGFYSCTLTTNAQLPFADTAADMVWVSMDGYKKYHDDIRGQGAFAKADKHIRESNHPNLSISMAVNKLNMVSVVDTIKYAAEHPGIKSIAFNFHTPFPETEALTLSWEERCRVINKIMCFKEMGYPIMNTLSGLKMMKVRGFKKECWVANYIMNDGTKMAQCPGKALDVCDDCGFCMAGEMHALLRLRPDTIFAGLNIRQVSV